MKIQQMSINSITPYENNPRINEEAVAKVAESIKRYGFRQPIVVDTDGVIIVGHTRYKAAKSLKLKHVPVHVADLDKDKAREYRIADNRTAEFADWDIPPVRWLRLASGKTNNLSVSCCFQGVLTSHYCHHMG